MPKNINQKTYKFVIVVILALHTILAAGSTVFGQAHKLQGQQVVPARVQISSGGYKDVFPEVSCDVYVPCDCPDPSHPSHPNCQPWPPHTPTTDAPNNYPLAFMDTSGLAFPFTTGPLPGFPSGTTINAADVDRYFDEEEYKKSAGYERIETAPGVLSTASFSMNCHGYSTGKNCWLLGLNTLLTYDYTWYGIGKYLGGNVIFANADHSIVAETTATNVNGVMEYKVVRTREKNGPSAIYSRPCNPVPPRIPPLPWVPPFGENSNVYLSIVGGVANGFHKKN